MAINMNRNNCWVHFCIRIRKCSIIIMMAHKWRTFRNKSGKVRLKRNGAQAMKSFLTKRKIKYKPFSNGYALNHLLGARVIATTITAIATLF